MSGQRVREAVQESTRKEAIPRNSQDPVCSWPSLLSTCVNAMLDKFLFEFPY